MSIMRFLGLDRQQTAGAGSGGRSGGQSGSADTETVRRIVDALDRLPDPEARQLAAFSYILSRVARADLEISPEETRAMERIVQEMGGLPEEQAILVVQMAKHQSLLFAGTENFLVTREFNRLASPEEKLRLLECLFAVSAADASISAEENHEIRRIASELDIEHRDVVAVRSAFREHLAVLKPPPG
jgi:uncharacterized tellurite resistance protein B-like protein